MNITKSFFVGRRVASTIFKKSETVIPDEDRILSKIEDAASG